jgi:hypothetical protein
VLRTRKRARKTHSPTESDLLSSADVAVDVNARPFTLPSTSLPFSFSQPPHYPTCLGQPLSHTDSYIPSLLPHDISFSHPTDSPAHTSMPFLEPFSPVPIVSQRLIAPLSSVPLPTATRSAPHLREPPSPPVSTGASSRLITPIVRHTYDDLDLDSLTRMPYLASTLRLLTS